MGAVFLRRFEIILLAVALLLSRTLRKIAIGSDASDSRAIKAEFGVISARDWAIVRYGENKVHDTPEGDEQEECDEDDKY